MRGSNGFPEEKETHRRPRQTLAAAMGMTESRALIPSGSFAYISTQVFWQMVGLMPLLRGLLESFRVKDLCSHAGLVGLFLRQCCLGWLLAQRMTLNFSDPPASCRALGWRVCPARGRDQTQGFVHC